MDKQNTRVNMSLEDYEALKSYQTENIFYCYNLTKDDLKQLNIEEITLSAITPFVVYQVKGSRVCLIIDYDEDYQFKLQKEIYNGFDSMGQIKWKKSLITNLEISLIKEKLQNAIQEEINNL